MVKYLRAYNLTCSLVYCAILKMTDDWRPSGDYNTSISPGLQNYQATILLKCQPIYNVDT